MADLQPLWQAGKVAAVHATGLPVANRSHFAAMEEMEDADPGSSVRVGWLNRLVGGTAGASPLQGFSAGTSTIPTSLVGPAPTMSAGRVGDLELPGDDEDGRRRKSLMAMWHGERSTLAKSMRATFDALTDVRTGPGRRGQPRHLPRLRARPVAVHRRRRSSAATSASR